MRPLKQLENVVIRFAGDSGDGMQLTGDQFGRQSSHFGNDIVTLPNFPAEIRAPQGSLAGVSSFQVNFASHDVVTPGDKLDVLVVMNPAALKTNLPDLKPGGILLLDQNEFTERAWKRVGYETNPLEDDSLSSYQVIPVELSRLTNEAISEFDLERKTAARIKNMYALGLVSWLFSRPIDLTIEQIKTTFSKNEQVANANIAALQAGETYGEVSELFAVRYEVPPATMPPGRYRHISGNTALSYGLMVAAQKAGLQLFLGAYPITPASNVLHELAKHKEHGVICFQAEDEISAAGAAVGASYGGALGVTVSSGPGIALKQETINLAVMMELPLLVVDVQRGGPSTGMPTKAEQNDLFSALHGRPGESPMPVLAAKSPSDCFDTAIEATRWALKYHTPVFVLSDAYLANGAEPWRVPDLAQIPEIPVEWATEPNDVDANGNPSFSPYLRDPETLARPLARPGTPGLEHRLGGLEKNTVGAISYAPDNHEKMVRERAERIAGIVREIPDLTVDDPDNANILLLGWGSTWGPITAAVRCLRADGIPIAQAHLRHLNPMPKNLGEVLAAYDRVVVPEMNSGQLALLLRAKYLIDIDSWTCIRGLPLPVAELCDYVRSLRPTERSQE